MPTYDYRCPQCGKFEYTQSITEPPLPACPTCGQEVKRLISQNVGIVFKGSGWYVTDSRKPQTGAGGTASQAKPDTAPMSEGAASTASAASTESTDSAKSVAKVEKKEQAAS